ncbi:MAG TPA: hypothetical protein VGN23_16555 [Verrucomicrobiae bacterium]|jgi:hypothetical protein
MNNVLKLNFGKSKRLTSLLGLSLDGSRLDGVVLRRTNGSLQLQQTFSATLTLDPLTAAPELVGREIRNHLEAAGVRERWCIVGLPLKWVLTANTELPPLPEADAASLLQIEAERGFHSDISTLQLADSHCALADGKKHVTLAGISKTQIEPLLKVLEAAKLKPVSCALGLTALQLPGNDGVLALAIGETNVGLQITCKGGIAALRAFEGAVQNEGARRELQAKLISRETRITLGQLPAELRDTVKRIRIFGPRELARQLADEMELSFDSMGLVVEVVEKFTPADFGVELPANAPVSAAFCLAARRLAEQRLPFEFLPPKLSVLEQFAAKYASGRLRSIGMTVAAIVAIVVLMFLYQEVQLIILRSQWRSMSAKVDDLNTIQGKIQEFQPWYDTSYTVLTILKQLTLAFPETGAVTVKSIEIHNGNIVTCTGTATDNTAWLSTYARLQSVPGFNNLTVEQVRGGSPMQVTFDFQWANGTGGAQ